jgi:hypothetical protein
MSDDRLTVSETRELLTESLSRAQDCATDLVRELSERDATIARLTAELVEARAAICAFAPQCSQCEALATRRVDGQPDETARCDECSPSPESHPWSHDLPHAAAIRAAGMLGR